MTAPELTHEQTILVRIHNHLASRGAGLTEAQLRDCPNVDPEIKHLASTELWRDLTALVNDLQNIHAPYPPHLRGSSYDALKDRGKPGVEGPITCRIIPVNDSGFGDQFPDDVLADLAGQLNSRLIPVLLNEPRDAEVSVRQIAGEPLQGTAKASGGQLTVDVRVMNTPVGARLQMLTQVTEKPLTLTASVIGVRDRQTGKIDPVNIVLHALAPRPFTPSDPRP